jgi:hypothetical protein
MGALNGLAYLIALVIAAGEIARFWGSERFIVFGRGGPGVQAGEEASFRCERTYSAMTDSGAPPHEAAK